MKTVDNESRLSRWSRRKQQTKAETKQEDQALDLQAQGDLDQLPNSIALTTINDEVDEEQAATEPPILTDADMPAIETLNSDSDFSLFMSSGVSDKLRNLALKQLFKAPHFNIRDGLDEYDEDYTFFEKLGDIVTCDMKHQIEVETLKKEAAQLEADKLAELDDVDADEPIDANLEEDLEEDLEQGLNKDEDLEEDLDEELPEDKSDGNAHDAIQKQSNIETNDVLLNPRSLDSMLAKIETLEGSTITKGESS
jgi:hypothetical protein